MLDMKMLMRKNPGLVQDIMSRMGWDDDDDPEPYMEKVAQLTAQQAWQKYCRWHGLGDSYKLSEALDTLRAAERQTRNPRQS